LAADFHDASPPLAAASFARCSNWLEDRRLLANITVTDAEDTIAVDGLVTLREAITSANNNPPSMRTVTQSPTNRSDGYDQLQHSRQRRA
jgi:hypothetical protein